METNFITNCRPTLTARFFWAVGLWVVSAFFSVTQAQTQPCDTLGEAIQKKSLYFSGTRDKGFLSGHNRQNARAYAEAFYYSGKGTHLLKAEFAFAYAYSPKVDTQNVRFCVWDFDPLNEEPARLLAVRKTSLREVIKKTARQESITIDYNLPLPAFRRIFIGYVIEKRPGDSLALWMEELNKPAANTAWVRLDSLWYPLANFIERKPKCRLAVFAQFGTPPKALFRWTNGGRCAGRPVSFYQEAQNSESLLWLFPGGAPAKSIAINPSVTYEKPGVYDVFLIATGACGTQDTLRKKMRVVPEPKAEAGEKKSICLGGETRLGSDKNNPNWAFLWEPAALCLDPTAAQPYVMPQVSTTFTLTATDSTGCLSVDTVLVEVKGKKVAQFLRLSNDSLIAPLGKNYQWFLDDSLIYKSKTYLYRPRNSGCFYAVYQTENGCNVRTYSATRIRFYADSAQRLINIANIFHSEDKNSLQLFYKLQDNVSIKCEFFNSNNKLFRTETLSGENLQSVDLQQFPPEKFKIKFSIADGRNWTHYVDKIQTKEN